MGQRIDFKISLKIFWTKLKQHNLKKRNCEIQESGGSLTEAKSGSRWWDLHQGRTSLASPDGCSLSLSSPCPHREDRADPKGKTDWAGWAPGWYGQVHEGCDGVGHWVVQRGEKPALGAY